MAANSQRVFSLAEANELVPVVAGLTVDAVEHLDSIRQQYDLEPGKGGEQMPESALKEVEKTLANWSEHISLLGALPKGYFTVDFQSPDPELLYCWTYGEEKIEFTHKVWESFSHRRPLSGRTETSSDHLRWIN